MIYSKEALAAYPELLQAAGAAFGEELEKTAGPMDFVRRLAGRARPAAGAISHGSQNFMEQMLSNSSRAGQGASGVIGETLKGAPGVAETAARAAHGPVHEVGPAARAAGSRFGLGAKIGLGGAAVAAPFAAYGLGQHNQAQADKSQRNMAFGAGAALGLAGPPIARRVLSTAQTLAYNPTGLLGGGGY